MYPLFICSKPPRRPSSNLFPYTTLFRSEGGEEGGDLRGVVLAVGVQGEGGGPALVQRVGEAGAQRGALDRKSTRLNSSHLVSSYAVFCLKKIKRNQTRFKGKNEH